MGTREANDRESYAWFLEMDRSRHLLCIAWAIKPHGSNPDLEMMLASRKVLPNKARNPSSAFLQTLRFHRNSLIALSLLDRGHSILLLGGVQAHPFVILKSPGL